MRAVVSKSIRYSHLDRCVGAVGRPARFCSSSSAVVVDKGSTKNHLDRWRQHNKVQVHAGGDVLPQPAPAAPAEGDNNPVMNSGEESSTTQTATHYQLNYYGNYDYKGLDGNISNNSENPSPPSPQMGIIVSFGPDANVQEDQNLFECDEEFELKMANEAQIKEAEVLGPPPTLTGEEEEEEERRSASPGIVLSFGIDQNVDDIPHKLLKYELDAVEFERKMWAEAILNGNGYFYNNIRNWRFAYGTEVCLNDRRPLLLYTQDQLALPGTECRAAHDRHPFVAFSYLLKHADVGSTVYISAPYFTDFLVLDELCHYAQEVEKGGKGLKINVIIGEDSMNIESIKKFIGGCPNRMEAVKRLGLRSSNMVRGFCHSKAVHSTAGMMTGSYNFTYMARLYNQEHGHIFAPGCQDNEELRQQLEAQWNVASPMVIERATTAYSHGHPTIPSRPKL